MVRRGLLLALVVALGLVLGAAPASAHAYLVSSNPTDGQVLDQAPSQLRMRLSEAVVLGSTSVVVVGANERHVLTDLRLVEQRDTPPKASSAGSFVPAVGADEAPVELVAALPPLSRGSYRVSLETVSADDLHRTAAVLVFGVGQQVEAAGLQETPPRLDEAALRWLVLSGLCLGLGAALFRRLTGTARHPRLVRLADAADLAAAGACALAGLCAAALLMVQVLGGGGSVIQVLGDGYGERWLLRELGLALLGAAALLRRGGRAPRSAVGVLAAGALAASTGETLLSHAGSGTSSLTRVGATVLHVTAASTWTGALVLLAVATIVLRREGVLGRALARGVLRRFGAPAAACVGVMVATGVYLASSVVASVDAVLLTDYGRVLLAKLFVTGLALGLGLHHTRGLHPHLRFSGGPVNAARTPGRSLGAEAGAVAAALALAAVLASGQPAVGPSLVRDPAVGGTATASAFADDLQEQVSLSPNRPGPNVAVIRVSNTRRPEPAPIEGVGVALYSPAGGLRSTGAGELSAPGQWSVPVTVTEAGATRLVVTVRRTGLEPTDLSVDWRIAQASPPVAVVSLEPLGGRLSGAGLVLAVLLLVGWTVVGVRTWQGRRRTRTMLDGVLSRSADDPRHPVPSEQTPPQQRVAQAAARR